MGANKSYRPIKRFHINLTIDKKRGEQINITFKINDSVIKRLTNIVCLFVSLLIIISCNPYKKVTGNDVYSIDIIQADQDYYTKAVLEYHLIDQIFKEYSNDKKIDCIMPNGKVDNKTKRHLKAFDKSDNKSILLDCEFVIPSELEDLKSGFQYRYYSFKSTNSAALQAFGITDTDHDSEIKYLVIDYIQFKDFSCPRIPTIRYAVGLRSELKIRNSKSKIDLTQIPLAELAAKVELNQASINFSLKTIGLTGKPARLNIPQGVNFNVTTYKDYQNAIQFLKSNLEEKVKKNKGENLVVSPELIPVMDEYRPNTKNSIDALSKRLIKIHKEIEKTKRKFKITSNQSKKPTGQKNITNGDLKKFYPNVSQTGNEIIRLYEKELDRLINDQESLSFINERVYSIRQYKDFLDNAVPTWATKRYDLDIKREDLKKYTTSDSLITQNSLFGIFPGRPKLNSLDTFKLQRLREIYFDKNSLTKVDFNRFLDIIDNIPEIENSDLDEIIDSLGKKDKPEKQDLVDIANKIEKRKEERN